MLSCPLAARIIQVNLPTSKPARFLLQWQPMRLCKALDINPGDVAAFVGAGGKTTSIWRIQAELAARGLCSILTTTTKIMEPVMPPEGALMLTARPAAARIAGLLDRAPRLAMASRRLNEPYPWKGDHPGL